MVSQKIQHPRFGNRSESAKFLLNDLDRNELTKCLAERNLGLLIVTKDPGQLEKCSARVG